MFSFGRRNGVNVRKIGIGVLVVAAFGCGGGTGSELQATVSGIVTDVDGNVVRNARVYSVGDKTKISYSNSSGAFVLDGVKEGVIGVRADLVKNGVTYYGENFIDTFANERTKSLNIVMGRQDQMAYLKGVVTNRAGDPLQGARIYANANGLGSLLATTNEKGEFNFGGFFPGVDYEIYATGRGYNSDATTIRFRARERVTNDFLLGNGQNPLLPAPQNLYAVAWTSPRVGTTTQSRDNVNLKQTLGDLLSKKKFGTVKRPQVAQKTRDSAGGNWIEVDLSWDPVRSNSLLGYGIYRGTTSNGATKGIEFVRDTLTSFFADADRTLSQNTNYYYEITALNVQYPDTNNSESDFSNRYGVRTLGDMTLRNVTQGPLRFNWNTAAGADRYTVFVFEDYPNIGVSPLWPADGNDAQFDAATTTGTSLAYNGPALVSGRRYYYVVLGHANDLDSRTISIVSNFTAN